MTLPEILSLVASIVSLIGGPISVYFSWRAANRAELASKGADELARRMTGRGL